MYYLLYRSADGMEVHIRDTKDGVTEVVGLDDLNLLVNLGVDILGVSSEPFDTQDNYQILSGVYVSPSVGRSKVMNKLALVCGLTSKHYVYDDYGALRKFRFTDDMGKCLVLDDICSVICMDDNLLLDFGKYPKKIGKGIFSYANRSAYLIIENLDMREARDEVFYAVLDQGDYFSYDFLNTLSLGYREDVWLTHYSIDHATNIQKGRDDFRDNPVIQKEYLRVFKKDLLHGLRQRYAWIHNVYEISVFNEFQKVDNYNSFLKLVDTYGSDYNLFTAFQPWGSTADMRCSGINKVWMFFCLGGKDIDLYKAFIRALRKVMKEGKICFM